MHETIRIAYRRIPCDLCGRLIQPGERYRSVRDEYTRREYREHIRCPCATPTVTPPPKPNRTIFNHACNMA